MTQARRYRLLCPIARALDRLGDRWGLLVLRDLHAGPARFGELLDGLSGIASNLLASRLDELVEGGLVGGLVRKTLAPHRVTVYELTPLGASTANLLYELAAFGSRLPPDPDPREPGNRRTVAVMLKVACSRVVDPKLRLHAELRLDGEAFAIDVNKGRVDIVARPAVAPQVILETDYESMVAVTVMKLEDFASRLTITSTEPAAVQQSLAPLSAAVQRIASDAPPEEVAPRSERPRRARRTRRRLRPARVPGR
jgi:DNA-binding HxlR family transcriptional regulator